MMFIAGLFIGLALTAVGLVIYMLTPRKCKVCSRRLLENEMKYCTRCRKELGV